MSDPNKNYFQSEKSVIKWSVCSNEAAVLSIIINFHIVFLQLNKTNISRFIPISIYKHVCDYLKKGS